MPKPHGLQTLPTLDEAVESHERGPAPVVSVHDPRTAGILKQVQRPNPSLKAAQTAASKRKEK